MRQHLVGAIQLSESLFGTTVCQMLTTIKKVTEYENAHKYSHLTQVLVMRRSCRRHTIKMTQLHKNLIANIPLSCIMHSKHSHDPYVEQNSSNGMNELYDDPVLARYLRNFLSIRLCLNQDKLIEQTLAENYSYLM